MTTKKRLWDLRNNQVVRLIINIPTLDQLELTARAEYCEWCPCGYDFHIEEPASLSALNEVFFNRIGTTIEDYLSLLETDHVLWFVRLDCIPSFTDREHPPTKWTLRGELGEDLIVIPMEEG